MIRLMRHVVAHVAITGGMAASDSLIQQVLGQTGWDGRLLPEDLRALTPLIYAHVTPYGHFRLDLTERLPLAQVGAATEAVG